MDIQEFAKLYNLKPRSIAEIFGITEDAAKEWLSNHGHPNAAIDGDALVVSLHTMMQRFLPHVQEVKDKAPFVVDQMEAAQIAMDELVKRSEQLTEAATKLQLANQAYNHLAQEHQNLQALYAEMQASHTSLKTERTADKAFIDRNEFVDPAEKWLRRAWWGLKLIAGAKKL